VAPPGNNPPNNPNSNLGDAINQLTQVNQIITKLEGTVASLGKTLSEKLPSAAQALKTGFEGYVFELQKALDIADDTKGTIDQTVKAIKSLRGKFFDPKNLKDAKAAFEYIEVAYNSIREKTKDNVAISAKLEHGQKRILGLQQEINEALKDTKNVTGEMGDELRSKVNKELEEAHRQMKALGRAAKDISVNHFTKQVHGVTKALTASGLLKNSRMDKYMAMGELPAKMKEARRARLEGNRDKWEQKRAKAFEEVKRHYEASGKTFDENDDVTKAAIDRKTHGGYLKRLLLGKTPDINSDVEMSGHGGGIINAVSGGLESSIGSIGKQIAEFSTIFAILDLIKDGYDKFARQNQQMEASLGKGGLFSGTSTGFGSVRANLTPDTAYTRLGLSFDRNLKIAQAIQEGGYNLPELVSGRGAGASGAEFGPGNYGRIQKAVVGTGRIAGFTDTEGVAQMMKMMNQYRETLESGDKFFVNIAKDTKAAGISTTKYISVMDDVLTHFDHMNRSMNETMGVMRALSRTGRVGADDLKTYMDFLGGSGAGGGQRSEGVSMFLRSGETRAERKGDYEQQKVLYQNLFGGDENNPSPGLATLLKAIPGITAKEIQSNLANPTHISGYLASLAGRAQAAAGPEGNTIDVNKLLDQIQNAAGKVGYKQQFYKSGNAVGREFGASFVGKDFNDKLEENILAIKKVLGPHNMGEFLNNPAVALGEHNEVAGPLLDMLGISREDMGTRLPQIARIGASQRIDDAIADKKQALELWSAIKGKEKPPADIQGYFKENRFNPKTLEAVQEDLKGTLFAWLKKATRDAGGVNPEEITKNLDRARNVGMETQTSADIIANAFAKWFNNIISLLDVIVDHFVGGGRVDARKWFQEHNSELRPLIEDNQKAVENLADAANKAAAANDPDTQRKLLAQGKAKQAELYALNPSDPTSSDVERAKNLLLNHKVDREYGSGDSSSPLADLKLFGVLHQLATSTSQGDLSRTTDDFKRKTAERVFADFMAEAGVTGDKGTLNIPTPTYDRLQKTGLIDQLSAAKLINSDGKVNPQGGYTLTVNNYSADLHSTVPAPGLNTSPDSGTGVKQPKPTIKVSP
jgi:hypothetical protein